VKELQSGQQFPSQDSTDHTMNISSEHYTTTPISIKRQISKKKKNNNNNIE
jgi:hypothetical protein